MREVRSKVEMVRPGRPLFVREWILGVDELTVNKDHDDDDDVKNAKGPPVDLQIMIVHGSCATERQFHYLLLSLEAKIQAIPRPTAVRCVLFDAVGCGESPVLTDYDAYSPDNMMKDITAVVETFMDPRVPIVWMGHSYGSSLILRLLASSGDAPHSSG